MPWYNDLRPKEDNKKQDFALLFPDLTKTEKKRIIKNLLVLRKECSKQIADKKKDDNLVIASWNIREFGHYKNSNS
jgi:hypothetical protein